MIALFRTALTIIVASVLTTVFAAIVIVAALLGVQDTPGGVYDRLPRIWSRAILWAAGARVTLEGTEHLHGGGPFIFTSNHVSLFDILALVGSLPRHYFIAKSELFKIPIFGPGMRAVGTIPIQRENQKSAFSSYDEAARRIRAGSSVVVFPEGTRGRTYAVRQFKKGPFVLAVKAGVPIVPCVVYGTIAILPKKSILIRPGRVLVRLLESVPTAGLDYEDRDALAKTVHDRMSTAMSEILASHGAPIGASAQAPAASVGTPA